MSSSSKPSPQHEVVFSPGISEAKSPLWKRRWVVVVSSGLAGFILGSLPGDGEEVPSAEVSARSVPSGYVEAAEIDDLVEEQMDSAVEQAVTDAVAEVRSDASAALAEARRQARVARKDAVAAAVRRTARKERAKADARVEAARNRARSFAAAPAPPAPTAEVTDPRFAYCYEANDAGYGSYVRGQDPEYDWYDDNDGDGVVCEF